jgi:hypothetical protein
MRLKLPINSTLNQLGSKSDKSAVSSQFTKVIAEENESQQEQLTERT